MKPKYKLNDELIHKRSGFIFTITNITTNLKCVTYTMSKKYTSHIQSFNYFKQDSPFEKNCQLLIIYNRKQKLKKIMEYSDKN